MKDNIKKRVINQANYYINNESTCRNTAKFFNVSKSTTHKDLTERLLTVAPDLYDKVRTITNYNLKVRSTRGGLATKIMWERKRIKEKIK